MIGASVEPMFSWPTFVGFALVAFSTAVFCREIVKHWRDR